MIDKFVKVMKKININEYLISLRKLMEKEYKKSHKSCLFPNVSSIIQSDSIREDYISFDFLNSYYSYLVENRDWEAKTIVDRKVVENDTKNLKFQATQIVKETINFQEELVFSLLDQAYSPIGTYGYWKYKEIWNGELLQFLPETKINETGRLIGTDNKPLFCTHFDSSNNKNYRNILFENLNVQTYKKARKLLLGFNKINKKDPKQPEFLLIVNLALQESAIKLENKLKKEEKSELLTVNYFKKLKWALMIKDIEPYVKPIIFQLREEPIFETTVDLIDSFIRKDIILTSNMRCNAAIGNWKKIVGVFGNDVKEEIGLL